MRRLKKELWPVRIIISRYNDDVEYWLEKNLGKYKDQWNAIYYHDRTDYYFKNEQDATFFALKWK